jgi:2-oxoisovalerate dehydrogenase E1 component
MTKSLLIDPKKVQQRSSLNLGSIKINDFSVPLTDSIVEIGKENSLKIYRKMFMIREFELMFDQLKKLGEYNGFKYKYLGPAHLSTGQEAAAVGQAMSLGIEDYILGSHRSHGEVLAKALTVIEDYDEFAIEEIFALDTYSHIALGFHSDTEDRKDRFIELFLYGLVSEILGKETGFNRGLGGSMHAFFAPFGIYPNNAIVGGSAPIATGMALFKRVNRCEGVVIANIGDAASSCGPVWEAMNFSAMAQFETLFDKAHSGGLPIIFFFMNNFYGMGGQPIGETMGYENLARIGAGVNVHNLHAEVIDGSNPFAVADAVKRAKAIIASGSGPVLIDCQTYRFSGHSPSDSSTYRTREELELWTAADPLGKVREAISVNYENVESELVAIEDKVKLTLQKIFENAANDDFSPRLDLENNPEIIGAYTFNNLTKVDAPGITSEFLMDPSESPRVQSLAKKSRSGGSASAPLSGMKAVTFRDSLFEAVLAKAISDPSFVIFGEENRDWDGAFGVYKGLTELLPRHRLFNSPIAEASIIGAGIGYAMSGGSALVELMYADFIGRAGDEIFNQMAKWQAMSGGVLQIPLVVRVSVGSKYGAQHSQDWSSLVSGIPGLKILYPATPFDAKGLLASALAGCDPVIFFENQRLYDTVEVINPKGVPAEDYKISLGQPSIVRIGSDLTLFSVGATLPRVLEAARTLSEVYGIEAEVIDARSIVPFDPQLLIRSVEKTKNLICISDGCERGNWLHSVSNLIYKDLFNILDQPIELICAPNWITPGADQEWNYFPTSETILSVVNEKFQVLDNFKNQSSSFKQSLHRRSARGI